MTSRSKGRRVPGRMSPPPAHRLAPGGSNVRTDEQSWHCRRYRNRLILPALSAYRRRLNKAFTIEIERPLSIRPVCPSGFVAEFALVGPHVAEQVEHLHRPRGLRATTRRRAPKRGYGRRQGRADPISEH